MGNFKGLNGLLNPYNTWPYCREDIPEKLVIASYESPEARAKRGCVRQWRPDRKNSLMVKSLRDGKQPVIGDWKNDTLDGKIEDEER